MWATTVAWTALVVVWLALIPKDTRGKGWHYAMALLPFVALALAAETHDFGLRAILVRWLEVGGAVLVAVALAWTWGTLRRNHGMMDIVYPLAVLAAADCAFYLSHMPLDLYSSLLLGSIAIWGLRLALQTYRQNIHAERQPYAHWRAKYGRRWLWWSAFQIHLLQAGMIWLWVAPIVFALGAPGPRPIALATFGSGVWLFGFTLQAIADRQLTAFRLDPAQRGKLLDRGVWSWVRHPNYLGEAIMWSGWFVFALANPWGWITLFAPIFNGWFMGYASAAPYKEQHMARTRGNLWVAYCERTPRFLPWPRRRLANR